jgi:hypothetical protein
MEEFSLKLKAGLSSLPTPCSALSFSALAVPPMVSRKLSQQVISQIIGGTKTFSSKEEALEFLRVVNTMHFLQENVNPRVPIDWANVLSLKDVLIETFNSKLSTEDPITTRCHFVRLSLMNFFKGLRSDGSVVTTINYQTEGAAFTDSSLAESCVNKLRDMGVTARTEILTAPRRRSTITKSLEELGFKTAAIGSMNGLTQTTT